MGRKRQNKPQKQEVAEVTVETSAQPSNVPEVTAKLGNLDLKNKALNKKDKKAIARKPESSDEESSGSEEDGGSKKEDTDSGEEAADSDAEETESDEEEADSEDGEGSSDEESSDESTDSEVEDSDEADSDEETEKVVVRSKFSAFAGGMDGMDMDDGSEGESSSDSDSVPCIPPPASKKSRNVKRTQHRKPLVTSSDESEEEEPVKPAPAPKRKASPPPAAKNTNQSRKNKKKGNKASDDDFDAILNKFGAEKPKPEEVSVTKEETPEKDEPELEESTSKSKNRRNKRKNKAAANNMEGKDGASVVEEPNAEPAGSFVQEKAQEKVVPTPANKKGRKGGPNQKTLDAMRLLQEELAREKEIQRIEHEAQLALEDERIKQEEERKKKEAEKKEKKKQKDKERKEKLKAEGNYLTPKQKAERARAMELVQLRQEEAALKKAELEAAEQALTVEEKEARERKRQEKKALKAAKKAASEPAPKPEAATKGGKKKPKKSSAGDKVVDSWDMLSSDEEEKQDEKVKAVVVEKPLAKTVAAPKVVRESAPAVEQDPRERVIQRLVKRKQQHDSEKSLENLRAPVVCVLGHVDHGKTKILDKFRRTNVQDGEVGGITQQIGATNVPKDAIAKQTAMVSGFDVEKLNFPGLLIIDTPGHESFSNLRTRGSSLCDIAILVIDITQGLQPQTIESLEMLVKQETRFVVALNKVDSIYEWEPNQHKDIRETIKTQKTTAMNDFERKVDQIILTLNENGQNACLFWENKNPMEYVSLVPTSAITGDGMGNLIGLLCQMCMSKKLEIAPSLQYTEELQCTVLEVKTIQGRGTTIDVILVNGRLREGDQIVLAGTDGAIVTTIRSLLMPQPMKELRVKGAYIESKEVKAAQGIKIAAKDLDKAIAGLTLRVVRNEDETELLKEVVEKDLSKAMRSFKVKDQGVYVNASTLGALEALLEFFKTKKIPYSGIRVGDVSKKDVMKASAMLEHDDKYAVILAFDVKVDKDAQELADREGVRIFTEETIYHLGDRYVEFLAEHLRKKQDENRTLAVFPCKLSIKQDSMFRARDPIIMGVTVENGLLRVGTVLCVPGKDFLNLGIVESLEFDNKPVHIAKRGNDVCIKISTAPGETPKLYGRHFDHTDEIVSKISRESIDACKAYFRDDLSQNDWKLMVELKKLLEIV